MEGPGGASIAELRIRDGRRGAVFGSYVRPLMSRPNLTVLTDALVTRLIIDGTRATGVEVLIDGQRRRFTTRCETVLSLGAINTPKVLMQSGIGPQEELQSHGIPVCSTYPGLVATIRIISHLALPGPTGNRRASAAAAEKQNLTGRAIRVWFSRTFSSASWNSLSLRRPKPASKRRNMAGRCSTVSPSAKVVVDFGSPARTQMAPS
nr:GMC family oxidoreductase N-terminal domain-containing protein [Rhizobium grahamii]